MKNISKFALLAGLLVMNTTVNGFFQCMPKKEWIEKIIQKKEDENWKFFEEIRIIKQGEDSLNITEKILDPGKYRFVIVSDTKQYTRLAGQYNLCKSGCKEFVIDVISFKYGTKITFKYDKEFSLRLKNPMVYAYNKQDISLNHFLFLAHLPITIKIYKNVRYEGATL